MLCCVFYDLISKRCFVFTAGKGFVEAVKNKTDEQLDEEVRMGTENIQVC